jgi:CMP-N-acetylneuraminic acid synthetase
MIQYAIEVALRADGIDEVYVNTDDEEMASVGSDLGAKVYMRDPILASDSASSDDFNSDIISKLKPKTLLMISPTCPLLTDDDLVGALAAYNASEADTLITCSETQMQVFCEGKPVNVSTNAQLAPSQENLRVQTLNWAVTIWDGAKFQARMQTQGHAVWGHHRIFHPIPALNAVKVSTPQDFELVSALMGARVD